ncbi:MAG: NAD(P)/FAD-dependent oxidoreductase [Myxococcota bacterium]|jgi:NADH:ubiquinone reductase (H+-translocating)|nr:NAD(P)/FAD-dependent oxidoreductase [Myxococcota bacterium]
MHSFLFFQQGQPNMQRVLIVGGGFGGLSVARGLAHKKDFEITVLDERNYHLFQPLLYQVAMAVLSPAEIAAPIRGLLSSNPRASVHRERAVSIDLANQRVASEHHVHEYDYLILACGARHSYFGNEAWEEHAPGLKNLEQATEIRRRVLEAFEEAETEEDPALQQAWLTFVVVGGGPTGVELAGALGEISRHTLARDFRRIDPTHARIILIEASPRILAAFSEKLSHRAMRDLEGLGVEVWTDRHVTRIDGERVEIGEERIRAKTTLWAAGVQAPALNQTLGTELDRQGRAHVEPNLTLPGHPNVFVIGDQAHCPGPDGAPLPGVAPVALQQGRYVARSLGHQARGESSPDFRYRDKGRMATIGHSRAVAEIGKIRFTGRMAWWAWLLVHIYYLVGFKNRIFVLLQWAAAFVSFSRGARLIVGKKWRFYPETEGEAEGEAEPPPEAVNPGPRSND